MESPHTQEWIDLQAPDEGPSVIITPAPKPSIVPPTNPATEIPKPIPVPLRWRGKATAAPARQPAHIGVLGDLISTIFSHSIPDNFGALAGEFITELILKSTQGPLATTLEEALAKLSTPPMQPAGPRATEPQVTGPQVVEPQVAQPVPVASQIISEVISEVASEAPVTPASAETTPIPPVELTPAPAPVIAEPFDPVATSETPTQVAAEIEVHVVPAVPVEKIEKIQKVEQAPMTLYGAQTSLRLFLATTKISSALNCKLVRKLSVEYNSCRDCLDRHPGNLNIDPLTAVRMMLHTAYPIDQRIELALQFGEHIRCDRKKVLQTIFSWCSDRSHGNCCAGIHWPGAEPSMANVRIDTLVVANTPSDVRHILFIAVLCARFCTGRNISYNLGWTTSSGFWCAKDDAVAILRHVRCGNAPLVSLREYLKFLGDTRTMPIHTSPCACIYEY